MRYLYPVIFTRLPDRQSFKAEVFDMPDCSAVGATLNDASKTIANTMAMALCVIENEKVSIPAPTCLYRLLQKFNMSDDQLVQLVACDTELYRKTLREQEWAKQARREGVLVRYRQYTSRVRFNPNDGVYYGKIEHIPDLVTFECKRIADARREFRLAVDNYLAFCKDLGTAPAVPA